MNDINNYWENSCSASYERSKKNELFVVAGIEDITDASLITEKYLRSIAFDSPGKCKKVIRLANEKIESLKQCYGFISAGWKPVVISHPWLFEIKTEARLVLEKFDLTSLKDADPNKSISELLSEVNI